ncbi:MAG: heavy metal-binding domain-containing protein [Sedimentisphaerales bacterium]|nr:heavy metal-binding domain-containing protein [Sedimentisphaerales bacterium]
MEGLAVLGMSLGLVMVGLIVGKSIENSHLRNLAAREEQYKGIVACNLKRIPPGLNIQQAFLVTGSAVIATDYFKVFAAGLRNLFGGEMKSYRSLMERARREAMLRMMEQAAQAGAKIIWNVRYETTCISGQEKNKPGGVEVIAYGTAFKTA